LAELAAGSPVADPRPLGAPLWAVAMVLPSAIIMVAINAFLKFILDPFSSYDNPTQRLQFPKPMIGESSLKGLPWNR
jgi:hypothetical protein